MTGPEPRRAHRAALGGELRRLRVLAGIGGREMAGHLGVSQSKVSRIETGHFAPSLREVRAWARAADAVPADLDRLDWLAEQALNEVIPFRQWRDESGVSGMQGEIRSLELSARQIAAFQPCFVPGLLQTAEYARRVLGTLGIDVADLDAAAAERIDRQAILHDRARRFEFILTDAALRWRSGPADMLPAQAARIASLATLGNVAIGVIPAGADMHAAPTCAFVLYEERDDGESPLAAVETPHARLEITGEVQAYRDELGLLRRSALFGADAIAYIGRVQEGPAPAT
jgi:transcriptional regulator with XRE-family HTH domain